MAATTASERTVEQLPGIDDLADAVLSLRDRDEVRRFLRDLCTLPELEALSHRWQTVRLLEEEVPYVEIAGRLGLSVHAVECHASNGGRKIRDHCYRRQQLDDDLDALRATQSERATSGP